MTNVLSMAKAKLKTEKTELRVEDFINAVPDDKKRKDSSAIVDMMQKATGAKPKMWGSAIVGFGDIKLKYDSGRELDWFKIGFSPRKQNLTLYGLLNPDGSNYILKKLGKHSTGKGCLYINKLEDIDSKVLLKMMVDASKRKK
jgi:hypothetical protein